MQHVCIMYEYVFRNIHHSAVVLETEIFYWVPQRNRQ